MKRHLVIFILTVIFALKASSAAPVTETYGMGLWQGDSYRVSVSLVKHLKAVRWDPENEIAPFSVPRAVAAARVSLRTMVGEAQTHFVCDEVKISQENGYWFYVIRFYSDHPALARKSEEGVYPAVLPFIVYLNGFVEPPAQAGTR